MPRPEPSDDFPIALTGDLVGTLFDDPSDEGGELTFRLRADSREADTQLDLADIHLPVRHFEMLAGLELAEPQTVELRDGEEVPVAGRGQLRSKGRGTIVTVVSLQFASDGQGVEIDLLPSGSAATTGTPIRLTTRLTDRRIVMGQGPGSEAAAERLLDLARFERTTEDGEVVLRTGRT